ncbi:hypothetical protein NHF48_007300 [Sphingomonas sp. H160509]|jgi:hypothetical protein|uniref:hypothetical protein n=1 Tax=Sphingomonas sp. H160509 TaxID=2955313 RepID=UPI002098453E|nr:hypothetical protein [Sphingomonas sp. H160509]MDD1450807.1 hypothetical protein [Sphingomonas sp. H160509]
MIDGGLVMIVVSTLFMLVPAAASRTRRDAGSLKAVLNTAYPPIAPTPAIIILIGQAEAALDRDGLLRGVRALSSTYDQV